MKMYQSEVVLDHRKYQPGKGPHMVTVRDRQSGNVLFIDTLDGTADWLDTFGYKWAGESGVWYVPNH